MNRGIIGTIIGVLVIIILVIVILQPPFPISRLHLGAVELGLSFAAFGVLLCEVLVRRSEILTAHPSPIQQLEEFSDVR